MRTTLVVVAIAVALAAGPVTGEDPGDSAAGKPHVYGDTPEELLPYGRFTEPYKTFFLEANQYHGYGREIPEPEHVGSVKIGFLGPIESTVSVATGGASHEEPLGIKMLQGARLAIEQANERGGYRQSKVPFELVVRNDNGLWGSSGNEIVDLAYNEVVWAILGTIDGANSHIAIRVALKAEVPMMNTGDTDPTLIETRIPWVCRNITDDRQMSYALADYVYGTLGLKRVAALRANNRYGRMSIDEFRDASTRLGHPFLTELNYPLGATDFSPQLERIKALEPDAVITWGDTAESALILSQMRAMEMDQLFIGSDRMATTEFLETVGPDPGPVVAGYPYDPTSTDRAHTAFVKAFTERFGGPPDAYAAHAYDGMKQLIEAIDKAGLNRALIRDEMMAVKTWHGATGTKVYDAICSNRSPALLALIEDGGWVFRHLDDVHGDS
jgi:ABC-type branched-subunit amino acid transport system substrate-binding protein